MAQKVILKKSSIVGKIPTVSDLDYGELALNYAEGKLYFKDNVDTIRSISGGGGGTVAVEDSYDFGIIGVNVLNINELTLQLLPYDFGIFNPSGQGGLTPASLSEVPLTVATNMSFNQDVVLDLGSFV